MVPLGSNHPQSGVNSLGSLSQPASNKTSSGMVIIKGIVLCEGPVAHSGFCCRGGGVTQIVVIECYSTGGIP